MKPGVAIWDLGSTLRPPHIFCFEQCFFLLIWLLSVPTDMIDEKKKLWWLEMAEMSEEAFWLRNHTLHPADSFPSLLVARSHPVSIFSSRPQHQRYLLALDQFFSDYTWALRISWCIEIACFLCLSECSSMLSSLDNCALSFDVSTMYILEKRTRKHSNLHCNRNATYYRS